MADENEVNLPKLTIVKMVKELLPQDKKISADLNDLLVKCCTEFVLAVSSEANEMCNNDKKTTISPEHVIRALESLGFTEFVDEIKATHEQWKVDQQNHVRLSNKKTAAEEAGLTEEEQFQLQQQMFASAKASMQ